MPSDDVSPFEFDLSKMTIGDTITIMRVLVGMEDTIDFKHHVALLEMIDRLTVGGIKHLPADVAELVMKDFADYYIKVFGAGGSDGKAS